MIWFSGTISSAIDQVKSSSSTLLVFIQGEDDLSKKYEKFLSEETKLKPDHYVAIKISNNSVAFEQFQKIYVTVPIPSVFVIGTNGMPLAVICSQKPVNLIDSIAEVVKNHKKEKYDKTENSKLQNEKFPIPKDNKETCSQVNSVDEKHKIDHENYKFGLEEKKLSCEPPRICPTFFVLETHFCGRTCTFQKIQSARIQFRLPTNEVRSWEFPNMCTLHDIQLYLMETMKLSPGFKLLRTYPRVAFTPQDENKTLTELSLTPNATLIVIPLHGEPVQEKLKKMIMKKNLLITFVTTIFQPVFTIFSYFKKLIMKTPEPKNIKPKRGDRRNPVHRRIAKKTSAGNVHGFNFDDSETDSDMNTDNGNSTQQK